MRLLALAILTGVGLAAAAPAAFAEARTTRIETRPFYGATVTLEEGVRVFRPLPRHDRVIINPGGQTPLSLNFSEARNYSYNHYEGDHSTNVERGNPSNFDSFSGDFRARNHRAGRGHSHHRRGHGGGFRR